jgi:hypothetical protein
VDEILLARILEQRPNLHAEYTDDNDDDEVNEAYRDEETEFEAGKGSPFVM